jgi:hypothetical protein
MSRPRIERTAGAIAAAVTLCVTLAGCSDIYFDRRDTVALTANDAVAANAALQTVDPWPAHSGNTNIAFNGQKMQSAVERYRTNRVVQPVKPTTSDVQNQQEAATAAAASYGAAVGNAPPPTSPSTASSASAQ